MFSNLSAEMARRNMTIEDLSVKTNISYESMKNKMSGATEFKRSEMLAIKNVFPKYDLDYLFENAEEVEEV